MRGCENTIHEGLASLQVSQFTGEFAAIKPFRPGTAAQSAPPTPGRSLASWGYRCKATTRIEKSQVIKQYARKRVVDIQRRVVQGASEQMQALIQQTQGSGTINAAHIELLNPAFRACIIDLVRRGQAPARRMPTLHASMYLIGPVYSFCTDRSSLRVAIFLPAAAGVVSRTSAIAAWPTDHRGRSKNCSCFIVPLLRWTPPKFRGTAFQGDESARQAMVHMTMVKCGATSPWTTVPDFQIIELLLYSLQFVESASLILQTG